MISIIALSIFGLCISAYAYFVQLKVAADVNYKPTCDISDHISCSKTMQSKYSNFFGFSNAIVASLFYGTIILLSLLGKYMLAFFISLGAVLLSVYGMYLLLFKIRALCPICVTLYVINIVLLICIYKAL